jgi:HK97 family phage major capsid protein
MTDENLIYFGATVKALGDGRVGGYLVRFGDTKATDLEGDYFSRDTDLGVDDGSRLPVYYQHGYDSQLKTRRIGRGVTKIDDTGLWFEAQLEMRDEYEKLVYQLAENGKLGWSSGAAGHLVEREQIGKAWHIKSWPIAEASLTPTPAEPRNAAMSLKSLITAAADAEQDENQPNPTQETPIMDEKELKAMLSEVAENAATKAAATAQTQVDEAVKQLAASLPEVKAGFHLEVVADESDRELEGNPFKSSGEFFKAVKDAATEHVVDKRLLAMKAEGINESIPSQGGFLVTNEVAPGLYQNMFPVGSVLSQFTVDPVSGNSMTMNIVDETSRKKGSRLGGVQSYWLAEAASKVKSQPKFRQLDLKLKKVAALVYATDEQLDDVAYMSSWITREVPNELRFEVEDSIINGDGAGKPFGILTSPAKIDATRLDASKIQTVDVLGMWARRLVGFNDYVWFIHQSITPQLYTMTVGDQPVYMPPGGMSGSQYATLLGRPVIETEYNPVLGSVGDILLASPSAYKMIDKSGGVQTASSIHVQFVTDETAFRFVYRVDGAPILNAPITPFQGSTTQSPFVALAATT